jgi:Ran GTPase-activating protein (RanGAP) involved in mRNA processing and transport
VANRTGSTDSFCGAELARGRGSGGCFSQEYLDLIYDFMCHLAYALHTRSSNTFRLFDVAFLVEHLFAIDAGLAQRDEYRKVHTMYCTTIHCTHYVLYHYTLHSLCTVPNIHCTHYVLYRKLWEDCILPMARHGDGRFPLITLVLRAPPPQGKKSGKRRKGRPSPNNPKESEGLEFFQISHLSFQEYFCALHTVRMSRVDPKFAKGFAKAIQPVGIFKFETVLQSERYQTVMQFCRELLQDDDAETANRFAASFLPAALQSSRGITIAGGLDTVAAAASLFGLVSFLQQDTPVNLSASGLNLHGLLGWRDALCPWKSFARTDNDATASWRNKGNGDKLKISSLDLVGCSIDGQGAKVLAVILRECSSLAKVRFSGDMLAAKKPVVVETFRNVVSFKGKKLGLPAAHTMSALIPKYPALRELDLSNNNLGELELPVGWSKGVVSGGSGGSDGPASTGDSGSPLAPLQAPSDQASNPLSPPPPPPPPSSSSSSSSSSVMYYYVDGGMQHNPPEGSTPSGIIALAKALGGHRTLQSCDLRRNNIGDEALEAMLEALDHSRSIETFSGIPIKQLETNRVRSIKLCGNDLGNNEAAVIAHYMRNNISLRTLDLATNFITATGAVHLGAAFETHRGLVKCDMTGNNIGREGTEAIFKALEAKNSALAVFNNIPFRRMKRNESDFHTLDLQNKSLSHEAVFLAQSIRESGCSALKSLLLANNQVALPSVGAAFAQLLSVNCTLTKLDLAGNAKFHGADGVEFARAISSGLANNETLTELNIAQNNLTSNGRNLAGLTALCKALKKNKGITVLTFSGDWSLSQAVTIDTTSMPEIFFCEEYLGQVGGEIVAVLAPKCKTLHSVEIRDDRIPTATVEKLRTVAGVFSFEFGYFAGGQLFSANYSDEKI